MIKIFGLAIPYGVVSKDMGGISERISPRAFSNSLSKHNVFCLYNHEAKYVLGRTSVGTLKLSETEKGIFFEVVPPDASWARDLTISIKRGDVPGMSFSFRPDDEKTFLARENGSMVRNVGGGRLFEISVVYAPAYDGTNIFCGEV